MLGNLDVYCRGQFLLQPAVPTLPDETLIGCVIANFFVMHDYFCKVVKNIINKKSLLTDLCVWPNSTTECYK
jgi:hypothetical protein